MSNYRFSVDQGRLILQVYETSPRNYTYGFERDGKWRDATVEDIPVADPFRSSPQWAPVESLGRAE